MNRSLIFQTTTRLLLALLLLFSIFILLRGHYDPGGGFAGGLVAASAIALYGLANGMEEARRLLGADPRSFIPFGLFLAVGAGLAAPVFAGQPFLTGVWHPARVPLIGSFGSPLVFDVGVYALVLGVTLTILFNLAQSNEEEAND